MGFRPRFPAERERKLLPKVPISLDPGRYLGTILRYTKTPNCRYLPGSSDMGTFGNNFLLVLPESEGESPWQPDER